MLNIHRQTLVNMSDISKLCYVPCYSPLPAATARLPLQPQQQLQHLLQPHELPNILS